MAAPALFVGVVSHLNSRFAASQGPSGLAAGLMGILPSVEIQINTQNLYDTLDLPLSSEEMRTSLSDELHLEKHWAQYLQQPQGVTWHLRYAMRWVKRAWEQFRPPDESRFIRLLNIELSHLDLMRSGLASGAQWILILEDDAMTADLDDLAKGLEGVLASGADCVSLSHSFASTDLGISHLLSVSSIPWRGSAEREILEVDRPITNTVCATLYSRRFLTSLEQELSALPLIPVIPIDWKINQALMQLQTSGQLAGVTCWIVDPAPITQMSMHADARLVP